MEPVFVLHGVGNRNRNGFVDEVAQLQRTAGAGWDLRPIYWGDLGADDRWVDLTIPRLSAADAEVREGDASVAVAPDSLIEGLLTGGVAAATGDLRDDNL